VKVLLPEQKKVSNALPSLGLHVSSLNFWFVFPKGGALIEKGDIEGALDLLSIAVERNPLDVDLLFQVTKQAERETE